MMDGWFGNGRGVGAWAAIALLMLIFWGGVVTVVVLLVARTHRGEGAPRRAHTLRCGAHPQRALRPGEIDEQGIHLPARRAQGQTVKTVSRRGTDERTGDSPRFSY